MSQDAGARPFGGNMFYVLSFVLIAFFAWRALVPAHSWPSPGVVYMQMLFDAGIMAGVVGTRAKSGIEGAGANILLVVALICGVGLFVIRLTSSPAWYSGHIVNTLS